MTNFIRPRLITSATALITFMSGQECIAQTTTYEYDALGRLVSSRANIPGTTASTAIEYDPAGNRRRYVVSGALATPTPSPTPSPTPTPTPTPGNQPPVANPDTIDVPWADTCNGYALNVVANDTDPDGNYPLTIVGVENNPYLSFDNTTVYYYPWMPNGPYTFSYTIRDALGATSSSTVTFVFQYRNCD